jgi:thiamine pyrophosphate-dependent acetolactate synthase large subunit-like protein
LQAFTVTDPDYVLQAFTVKDVECVFQAFTVKDADEIEEGMHRLMHQPGPVLMEVKIRLGSRSDLGRPTRTTQQNKADFMAFVSS